LDLWSRCRDARATEESCQNRAKRDAFISDPDDVSFQEAVRECLAERYTGKRCQEGFKRARMLVEEGRLPE
jgi:hypothetical protein